MRGKRFLFVCFLADQIQLLVKSQRSLHLGSVEAGMTVRGHDAHKKVLLMVTGRLVMSQSIVVSHQENALISVETSLTSLSYSFCVL